MDKKCARAFGCCLLCLLVGASFDGIFAEGDGSQPGWRPTVNGSLTGGRAQTVASLMLAVDPQRAGNLERLRRNVWPQGPGERAVVLSKLGRTPEALRFAQRAARLQPAASQAHALLA